MGQLYSKLNQLAMNDVDSAADPDRPRQKLETAFTTPARVISVRLDDPRSATINIDRTPIYVAVNEKESGETPRAVKTVVRPRYLETNLDDVLPKTEVLPKALLHSHILMTSTPVPHKPAQLEEEGEDESPLIDEIMNDISDLKFSDTGTCEVVTSEFISTASSLSEANKAVICSSGSNLQSEGAISLCEEAKPSSTDVSQNPSSLSFAEEVVITSEEVEEISCIEVVTDEPNTSLMVNWSGVGGLERSVGCEDEISAQQLVATTYSDCEIVDTSSALLSDSQCDSMLIDEPKSSFSQLSDSMIVHNDSQSFDNHESDCSLQWESTADSLLVDSPALICQPPLDEGDHNKKNLLATPQKNLLSNKPAVRTPLGDVSTNSPIISTNQQNTKLLMLPQDAKIWKNVRDERLKMGLDAENTPPHSAFNSMPPEVVQSAPGKIRTKALKTAGTKWSNDSFLI